MCFFSLQMFVVRRVVFCPVRCFSTKKPNAFNIEYDPNEKRLIYPAEFVFNGRTFPTDSWTNVTGHILARLGTNIYRQKNHPLFHLTNRLKEFFHKFYDPGHLSPKFSIIDDLSPIVTTEQNFDSICTPIDHVSRTKSMNYYINEKTLLRAHTSAHQVDLMRSGLNAFLCLGDVYRRDSIDPTHYPIFHQCEGVRLFNAQELFVTNHNVRGEKADLKVFHPDGKFSREPIEWRHFSIFVHYRNRFCAFSYV